MKGQSYFKNELTLDLKVFISCEWTMSFGKRFQVLIKEGIKQREN